MSSLPSSIEEAQAAIEKAHARRETAIDSAFRTLQDRNPKLAQTLLEGLRDPRKAARWMCLHHRAFDGKNAYQVLVEGHDDLVWDEVVRSVVNVKDLVFAK